MTTTRRPEADLRADRSEGPLSALAVAITSAVRAPALSASKSASRTKQMSSGVVDEVRYFTLSGNRMNRFSIRPSVHEAEPLSWANGVMANGSVR
jgi:hypothetical protein